MTDRHPPAIAAVTVMFLTLWFSHFAGAQECPGASQIQGQVEPTKEQIYFVTNRLAVGNSYGYEKGPLQYGTVSVPFLGAHPPKFFALMGAPLSWKTDVPVLMTEGVWSSYVAADISSAGLDPLRRKDSVIIYIHGFANDFHDAICRAAEIKHRARFEGAMVAFSWPASQSVDAKALLHITKKYQSDATLADESVTDLVTFLKDLSRTISPSKTVLVAHSMGNRVLIKALKQLPPDSYKAIVLLAPDLSKDELIQSLPSIDQRGTHVSMYVNRDDFALLLSSGLNLGERAGISDNVIDPMGKMETVDITVATSEFGPYGSLHHSDHLDGTALYDLFWNIVRNMPAKCREERGLGYKTGSFWTLNVEDAPYEGNGLDPDCRIDAAAYK
jgi:esterase/lipase superfamily enzyme